MNKRKRKRKRKKDFDFVALACLLSFCCSPASFLSFPLSLSALSLRLCNFGMTQHDPLLYIYV